MNVFFIYCSILTLSSKVALKLGFLVYFNIKYWNSATTKTIPEVIATTD